MNKYKYNGAGNSGLFSWLMQRISAVVLLFAIAFHFFGMTSGAYDGMVRYVLGCILFFGVWHAINGLKMITDDYVSCRGFRVILLFIYWVLGIAILVQGISILP